MLHHLSFGVSDITRSSAFYDAVLAPLGYRRVLSMDKFVGYGIEDGKDKFAVIAKGVGATPPSPGFHLAFSSPSRSAVDAFHEAAVRNGGRDNGAPGLRAHYGDNYYAAFVLDPDGHAIEAVINRAE